MQNIYYENYPKQNSNFNCKATDNIKYSEYKNAPKTRKNRNSKPKIAAAVFVWSTILLGAFSLNLPNFIEPVYLNRLNNSSLDFNAEEVYAPTLNYVNNLTF